MDELDRRMLLEVTEESFTAGELVTFVGDLIDLGMDEQDSAFLEKAMSVAEKVDQDQLSKQEEIIFNYNISNGWSNLLYLRYGGQISDWIIDRLELSKSLYHLRKCIMIDGFSEVSSELRCNIYTNLGNHFSHVGRFVEALESWRKVFDIDPDFPMALGNIGMGMYRYASHMHLESHRSIFVHQGYQFLQAGYRRKTDLHPAAAADFGTLLTSIESHWPKAFLNRKISLDFPLGKQRNVRAYKEWGIAESLYLNPLNDLGAVSIASHDCLHLPSMIVLPGSKPKYHSLYNQLKQEYGTARFLYFEATQRPARSHADKDLVLVDTLDYSDYSFNLEKVKIAYRLIYSIFDKIAYLINDYLEVGIPLNQISFRALWHLDRNGEQLRPPFRGSSNLPLKALYWLSKDLFDRQGDHEVIEPEAQELADIRNHIEHRSFKIKQYGSWGEVEDNFTFVIGRDEFEIKALKQLKLVRAALIYLSMAIHHEEKAKETKHVIPQYLPDMRQDYRI